VQRLVAAIEKINQLALSFCGILCFLLVFLTFQQVVARYFFDAGSIALQELQWHFFGMIFLLSSGAALHHNTHVRVDVFYHRYPRLMKKIVHVLGIAVFLLPSMSVLIYFGLLFALEARGFMSPRPIDHFTSQWFSESSRLYHLAINVESLLRSWLLVGEVSSSPSGLEARWLIKMMIPLGALLLFLQGISELAKICIGNDPISLKQSKGSSK